MYHLTSFVRAIFSNVSNDKLSMLMFFIVFNRMTDQLVPAECAVKVFKTTLVDFKNRIQYVKGDVRFFKDDFKKHNPRRVIKIWAEKEDHNLRR